MLALRSNRQNGRHVRIPAYLAVDVGSEMPAYEVYRSTGRPPFDWRHAAFQKLRLTVPEGPAANKETTKAGPLVQAAWIAASPRFARWATTP